MPNWEQGWICPSCDRAFPESDIERAERHMFRWHKPNPPMLKLGFVKFMTAKQLKEFNAQDESEKDAQFSREMAEQGWQI